MPPDHRGTVQQLMFNRILRAMKLAAIDGVTITRFDAETGTVEGYLADIRFVVNISTAPRVAPESE